MGSLKACVCVCVLTRRRYISFRSTSWLSSGRGNVFRWWFLCEHGHKLIRIGYVMGRTGKEAPTFSNEFPFETKERLRYQTVIMTQCWWQVESIVERNNGMVKAVLWFSIRFLMHRINAYQASLLTFAYFCVLLAFS